MFKFEVLADEGGSAINLCIHFCSGNQTVIHNLLTYDFMVCYYKMCLWPFRYFQVLDVLFIFWYTLSLAVNRNE